MTLSAKQQAFVAEYMVDLNAKQAAIRAGYSPASAHVTASRLLNDANVAEAVEVARTALRDKAAISAEWVLEQYRRIADADIRDIITIESGEIRIKDSADWTDEQAAAIAEVSMSPTGTLRVKQNSKQAALDSLSKHLGLFNETIHVEHSQHAPLTIQHVFPEHASNDRVK